MQKALYRAYRPQTFDEVVGQEAIVTALKNQVMSGQIGHAYLFAGTRGTGKTSNAKIFARAVNCLHPVDGNPCNECANCRAILEEKTMDVVEMDAASNRRIDDIRELRDTVIYPPSNLKYKVYIIDEAHMITTEGFNALLKIMEEPPEHLIFVLATTEPERIPQTILSRVQRYEFKRMRVEEIAGRVEAVAKDVGMSITPEAVHTIALAADGAMRDGLSLLDQVRAMAAGEITEELVEEVLGTVGQVALDQLTEYVFTDRMAEALSHTQNLFAEGKEAATLLREWLDYFRTLLLLRGAGREIPLPLSAEEKEKRLALVANVPLSRVTDSIRILTETDVLLAKSDFAETLFLATVARLIDYVAPQDMQSRLAALEQKLSNMGRWESPATMVRNELDKIRQQEGWRMPSAATAPAVAPRAASAPDAAPAVTSAPQTAPGAPASGFAADPMGWMAAHEAQWKNLVQGQRIVAPAMLGKYTALHVAGDDVFVEYPPGSMVAGLLKKKEAALSKALSQLTGGNWNVHIGEKAPRRNAAASAGNGKAAAAAPSQGNAAQATSERAVANPSPERKREQQAPSMQKEMEDPALLELKKVFPEDILKVVD